MPAPADAATAPAPPPVDLVNVQIDGVWHKFPKGTRMIEACRQVEAHVPHYCYHPKLSSPGNCRMCLVETGMPPRPAPGQEPDKDEHGMAKIGWMPRPVIACANTVADGMGIRTDSLLTKECRRGVMEFLLINHPLDCPICDQAGECRLQEFSVEHGKGGSRFREDKVKKPKNVDIGPRVRLDDERCIMCSRCIRFTAEIADDPVLGFTDRGSHTTLAVHPGKRLENNYSLNTVDICPVGALTSNDFRFQMRVWFLSETNSICTACGRGCNSEIGAIIGAAGGAATRFCEKFHKRRLEPLERDAFRALHESPRGLSIPPAFRHLLMPIYEFYCPQNNTLYSFLARTLAYRDKVPVCPDNPALPLQKRVSRFAIIGKAREDAGDDPFGDIDDTKMEALMAEMEGEMAGMDDENPNPRQLGRFMRKLTDVMGDKTPPELREIVKRLEAGEDPEKLESEFGDLDEDGSGDAIFSQVKKMIRGAKQPVRDPKLYEIRDWVR